jgi:hypothetical protein
VRLPEEKKLEAMLAGYKTIIRGWPERELRFRRMGLTRFSGNSLWRYAAPAANVRARAGAATIR